MFISNTQQIKDNFGYMGETLQIFTRNHRKIDASLSLFHQNTEMSSYRVSTFLTLKYESCVLMKT